jgi:hypothetical protein
MAEKSKPAAAQGSGEFRSGPVAGTALIGGATFAGKGLHYANVEGQAIFEGDIVLGTVEEAQQTVLPTPEGVMASIGISGAQFRWPNATVPYEIDPALPNQQRVTDAIAHWQANTRIRFVQRTAANAAQHPDFVRFVPGSGCSSMVGRRGGQQNVTLGGGCTTGNCIHELGHAVGLWHEQSREDRDVFIEIIWANIDPSAQHNFTQHVSDGDDLGSYDYGSIMHYPPNAFSINGQNTLVPRQALPAGVVMGQRSGLSAGDIAGVHAMYPAPTIKEAAKDPLADPTRKEAVSDPTFKEARKDPVADPTLKEVRKDPIQDPATIKEIRKDPIQDPTFKEVRKDPVTDPITLAENVFQPGPGPLAPGEPFVMGAPSRVGGPEQALAEAAAQVEEISSALIALEQQRSELVGAYVAAVQLLDALRGG